MKILILTENVRIGGLDLFICDLVNSWPRKQDDFIVMLNRNHPGVEFLRKRLPPQVRVITHDLNSIYHKLSFSKFIRGIARIPLNIYVFVIISIYLIRLDSDRLLVVNGGYPGGFTCIAASVAWAIFKRGKPSWHNYHNYAIKPAAAFYFWDCFLDFLVMKSALGFTTVSKACAKSLINRPVLRNVDSHIIHNGTGIESEAIENQSVNLREMLQLSSSDRILLMLGVYEDRKGHEFLFKAFDNIRLSHPSTHLICCGFGSPLEIQKYVALSKAYQSSANIHLLGFIGSRSSLIRQADILVIPSQGFESFGLTSIEAMALRIPVVCTDVGGLPEVITDGITGFISSRCNHSQFADSVSRLLSDQILYKTISENAFAHYTKFYKSERMSAQYASLLSLK